MLAVAATVQCIHEAGRAVPTHGRRCDSRQVQINDARRIAPMSLDPLFCV